MLSNVSITYTHWLQPPAYGFEGLMRVGRPPTEHPRAGTHYQHELRISGEAPHNFSSYHLRVDVFVRGALWRSEAHPLCMALQEPELEVGRYARTIAERRSSS